MIEDRNNDQPKNSVIKNDKVIETRKEDHVNICLSKDVKAHYNFWDDVHFVHHALPEIDFSEIDTKVDIFSKELSAPIIISAITGGYPKAEVINRNLAEAASKLKIGLGVGSQRAALENESLRGTYSVVKEYKIPLVIGNIGAPQLIFQEDSQPLSPEKIEEAFEMVAADVLAVHLNYLQEVVQPEGNVNARGCLSAIKKMALRYPLIAKETGSGISRKTAQELRRAGVIGIDVGGLGGTSFSAVEVYRAKNNEDSLKERLGRTFWDWGIPTPVSVIQANVGLEVIATGGIRNGVDVARTVALGANSAGMAGVLLEAATKSADEVIKQLEAIIHELKVTMFLTQSMDISDLKKRDVILLGRTKEWAEQVVGM
jgi:isopentenyl-diphosphate delta-isomerase